MGEMESCGMRQRVLGMEKLACKGVWAEAKWGISKKPNMKISVLSLIMVKVVNLERNSARGMGGFLRKNGGGRGLGNLASRTLRG